MPSKRVNDPLLTQKGHELLPCKLTPEPHFAGRIPCCNATLKIGVVLSLGMGDATALQQSRRVR